MTHWPGAYWRVKGIRNSKHGGLCNDITGHYRRKFDAKSKRLGLTYQQKNILCEAIQPGHPANPWVSKAQLRNCMIINMVLATGMRRGEFLSLRILDIDFRRNVISIRRFSDTLDPRLYRSNVTRSRVLPINGFLARLVQDYILTDRRKPKGSRSHDYLAVSSIDGSPLSGTAFDNIFSAVRDRVPGMPLNFSGNLCRHTWNDRICDYGDLNGIVGRVEEWFAAGLREGRRAATTPSCTSRNGSRTGLRWRRTVGGCQASILPRICQKISVVTERDATVG